MAVFSFAEDDPLGFGTDGGQPRDNDRRGSRHERECKTVIAAEMRGNAGLKRRVHRRQEVAELIHETGKRPSRGVR
jgi:hypothetical protein